MTPDFTVVVAIDAKHFRQFKLVLPTWLKHKPSLFQRPMLIICDGNLRQYDADTLPYFEAMMVQWPDCIEPNPLEKTIIFESDPSIGRFGDGQRYKMLAAFIHCAAKYVKTPYWLKLDVDVVATGMDDWIDPRWFEGNPGIIGHPWGYSKPANQMQKLDQWVENNPVPEMKRLSDNPPLNLPFDPNSSACSHARIISWCSFFSTEMTQLCSHLANATCGLGKLPVPSQDGLSWFVAKRAGYEIRRENMKCRGWSHCRDEHSILDAIERSKS